MRVQTRPLLVDSAIALGLGVLCLWGAHFSWDPERFPRDRRFGPPDGPPLLDLPEVAGWVVGPVLIVVAGLAIRRIWPRSAFVTVVVGVGGYLAAGAIFAPIFLAPALTIYAMAMAVPVRRWLPLTVLLVPMIMARHWSEPYLGVDQPRVVRRAGAGYHPDRRSGHVRPAPPQPAGE